MSTKLDVEWSTRRAEEKQIWMQAYCSLLGGVRASETNDITRVSIENLGIDAGAEADVAIHEFRERFYTENSE